MTPHRAPDVAKEAVLLSDRNRPVFAGAGMGIAPMAGMLSHLVTAGSGLPITLLHADLD